MLLRLTWLQSFGEEHIVSLNTVKKKLKTKLKIYSSKVQKAKGSKRINMAKWSQANKEVINLLKPGVEPDKFAKPEKDFYFDQVNLIRTMRLSHDSDSDKAQFEECENLEEKAVKEKEHINLDMSFRNEFENMSIDFSYSTTRSGKVWSSKHNEMSAKIPLRSGVRNFNENIKVALASSCSAANISPNQAKLSFQKTSEIFFGMKYFMTAE